jgi:drug/metabolite transporter (DMT)-like permease
MNLARLLGIAIAAAGIVFLIAGLNATGAPVERLSETFTGKYTQETIMYIAGGLAAIVAGVVVAITASRQ